MMLFKKRNIGGGDPIYLADGTRLTVDSWSPGTGQVWGNYPNGTQVCLNAIEDDLSWYPPFVSTRT